MIPPKRSTRRTASTILSGDEGREPVGVRAGKKPRQRFETHSEPEEEEPVVQEAPLPPGAKSIPTKDPNLPFLYEIPEHSKVPKPHGKIIMAVYDWRKPAMESLFKYAATLTPPASDKEAIDRGFCLLTPSADDRLVLRAKYGSGSEEDDRLGSWSNCRERISPDLLRELQQLSERVLGPQSQIGPNKAYLGPNSTWIGGIAFERSCRAIALRSGPRCYSVGCVSQIQRRLTAPGAQCKTYDLVKDDDALLRFNLVKFGSQNGMLGMDRGPSGLVDKMKKQASLTNLPHVGSDGNFAHPFFQLNAASAAEPMLNGSSKIAALGKFGRSHLDGRDSPGVPTAMHILSPEYDGVQPEYFYMMELGIGWLLEPFSTLYFSGLHFHGGSQPVYKRNRMDKSFIYYRIALIAYPPDDPLSGEDAVCFASLPNGQLLLNGYEFRQANRPTFKHFQCEQATFTGDGTSIMEPISYLRHWSNSMLEMTVGIMQQMDPTLLPRIDAERFLSSISAVIDGERVRAPSWDLAPGWEGKDVEIGKKYVDLLQTSFGVSSTDELAKKDPDALIRLWNSDNHQTEHPFNKRGLTEARNEWNKHVEAENERIPVCVKTGRRGRLASKRRGAMRSAQNPNSKQRKRKRVEVEDGDQTPQPQPKKRKKQPTPPPDSSALSSPGSFLEDLTLDVLHSLLGQASVSSLPCVSSNQWSIIPAIQDLLVTPFSGGMIIKARSILTRLGNSRLDIVHHTAQQLLVNFVLWNWLELQAVENSTLEPLRLKIKEASKACRNQSSVQLDAADYFDGLTSGEIVYLLTIPYHANHIPTQLECCENMIKVLATWFNMPPKSREKSWFVRAVLNSPLGFIGLHLAPIVSAADNLAVNLLNSRSRIVKLERIDAWAQDSLLVHPVCDQNSEHFAVAAAIAANLDASYPFEPDLISQVKQALTRTPQCSLQTVTRMPLLSTSQSVPVPDQKAFGVFLAMLKGLQPLISSDFVCPTIEGSGALPSEPKDRERALHNCFLARVHGDTDKRLPFRNSAVSRKHILEPGGPYDPQHVRTKSGLFSALIYRGITHNTQFLQNNKTLFKDLDDWKSTLQEPHNQQRQKTYFCKTNAYGVPIKARSSENVSGYWKDVSEDPEFTAWLTSDTKIVAPDLFNKIRNKCLGFGPLTSFQIVMDYVESGMTQLLTVEQMGWFIWTLRLGGHKGLITLGYTVTDEAETSDALRSLSAAMMEALSDDERQAMGFGLILIEHSLCKLGRLDASFRNWNKVATALG